MTKTYKLMWDTNFHDRLDGIRKVMKYIRRHVKMLSDTMASKNLDKSGLDVLHTQSI